MTRKHKPYKTYTKEFKEEAVRLLASSNRPAAEIAMELGIEYVGSDET
jgi:transposase